jgi:hypothetical protein
MERSFAALSDRQSRLTPQLLLGVLLVGAWWILGWGDFGAVSHYYFFPLWFGYILIVDSLVWSKTGTSPIARLGWRYALVFLVSAPFWWWFELLNRTISNWSYVTPWDYGWLGQAVIGSLSFSTVIPAVLTTAELIFAYSNITRRGPRVRFSAWQVIAIFVTGWVMLVGMLIWPSYLFPLCWISIFFIIDPLARLAGVTTVSHFLERGDWRSLVSLSVAGLICGWFWEMWNFLAMPKWEYSVPHVGFLRIWEMPILGYGGYIPFAFEVMAFYALLLALLPWIAKRSADEAGSGQIDRSDGRFI